MVHHWVGPPVCSIKSTHAENPPTALSHSAASELLYAFCAGGGVDLIRKSVRRVLQELFEIEVAEVIGAVPHRRTETCTTERNGLRPRLPAT